ncbi:hypothetical protein F7Q99_36890 [Streptomyces kaniharaensis]|uniref:Uncharacterized protein n=1 Tax=Streptomyces kaniharaensis TaxID=212423 RepID=A0A6N7L456_9ACTN|nr:hypothetical protein [Streptomyces kaniharaensis]MQS17619.1 hypothetical protein [Streptomyces kaniharaensis]
MFTRLSQQQLEEPAMSRSVISARRAAAVSTALALTVLPTAAPAAAQTRSSDACTHHWSGPKICIEIYGSSIYMDRVVAKWTNPPRDLQGATAHLREGDREVIGTQQAHRVGGELVAEWHPGRSANLSSEKVCVTIDGGQGRWACQEIINR